MKRILILLIISTLFIVSCNTNNNADVNLNVDPFLGGTEGLIAEYSDGAPPATAFDRNFPFNINIQLENKGEYDIPAEGIQVTLKGIDASSFGKEFTDLQKTVTDELKGSKKDPNGNELQGYKTSIDFSGLEYQQTIQGKFIPIIQADICYQYGTKANSELCVLEDLFGQTRRATEAAYCDPNGEKTTYSSSAPIQISNVRQSTAGTNKIIFSFYVTQNGDGFVYKNQTTCNSDISNRDVVFLKVITDLGGLSCTLENGKEITGGYQGYATLYSNQRQIQCTQQIDESNLKDFIKPIQIEATYDYKQKLSTEMEIKHSE